MRPFSLFLALPLIFCSTVRADELKWDGELGHQFSQGTTDRRVSRNRPYALASMELTHDSLENLFPEASLKLNAAARAWTDVDENELSVRALNGEIRSDRFSFKLGFQDIPWGETFGVFIADIVNPRDLRDPLFNEMSWVRLPVAAANLQLYFDSFTLQAVFNPLPRMNQLPVRGSAFDLLPASASSLEFKGALSPDSLNAPKSPEFGGKISHLFEGGLDLGLFAYDHYNRNEVFFVQASPQPFLYSAKSRVQSYGLTGSQTFDKVVVRVDSVLNHNQPLAAGETKDYWQTIAGADITTDSEWTWGGQAHLDHWGANNLSWLSAQASKPFFENKVQLSAFVFQGLNNSDTWIQPKITWNATNALAVSLRGDFVRGAESGSLQLSDGYLSAIRDRSRVMSWLSIRL